MAKLVFRYGAMGASKTANALMVQFNYKERGMNAVILKPACETRDGLSIIQSRMGLSGECTAVERFLAQRQDNFYDADEIDAIIVDEAQFMTRQQVEQFAKIVDDYDIPVLCYGLRTDFQGNFFEGSRRLMEIADNIQEIPTICWCGKKARFNARISNGRKVESGEQFGLGGNDMYIALCRKHFMMGQIGPQE